MRCKYCRSFTHEENCPKELADRILPVYSTVKKLEMMETRAKTKQIPLYSMPDAQALLKEVLRLLDDTEKLGTATTLKTKADVKPTSVKK